RGSGRVVADHACAVRAPLLLERHRAIAAEIPRVAPKLAVLVEVLGGEEIDGQRLDPRGRLTVARGADEDGGVDARPVRTERHRDGRPDELVFAQIRGDRSAPAHALEAYIGDLLRSRGCADQRARRECGPRPNATLHPIS